MSDGRLQWADPPPGLALPAVVRLQFEQEAVRKRPDDWQLRLHLAQTLVETGNFAEAEVQTRPGKASAYPADLVAVRIRVLNALDRQDEARELLRDSLATDPRSAVLLNIAVDMADNDTEKRAAARMLVEETGAKVSEIAALAYGEEIGNARWLEWLEANPARLQPAVRELLRYEALVALGRHREARTILDPALLRELQIDMDDAFHARLLEELERGDGLVFEPRGVTTRGGRQGTLNTAGSGVISRFYDKLKSAAQQYCDWRQASGIPLAGCNGVPLRIQAWAVALDSGGHQDVHYHRGAVLSGVAYLTGSADGKLQIPVKLDRWSHAPSDTREIPARQGSCVIFPSHFPHQVTPHGGAEPRVCVAFDLIAA